MYHAFTSPSHYALYMTNKSDKRHASIAQFHISTVRNMIKEASYKKEILYCTNSVNKKL
jgi:hypothetical protein